MEYSKNAIQFAFLLNGAAATALLSKSDNAYLCAAIYLAMGAGLAVLCMGTTYVTQILLCETWIQEKEPYNIFFLGKWRKFTYANIELTRMVAIALWILSMAMFFVGTYKAATSL